MLSRFYGLCGLLSRAVPNADCKGCTVPPTETPAVTPTPVPVVVPTPTPAPSTPTPSAPLCGHGTKGVCEDSSQCCSIYGYCYTGCDFCCTYYYSGLQGAQPDFYLCSIIRAVPHR